MPEFGDVDLSYWSLNDTNIDLGAVSQHATFEDPYTLDIMATPSQEAGLTAWVGDRTLVGADSNIVTAQPTPINYDENVAPSVGGGFLEGFKKIFSGFPGGGDIFSYGAGDLLKDAAPILTYGAGDLISDVAPAIGGDIGGAIGSIGEATSSFASMLPLILIMTLMKD